jgi:UDP-N-acetylglucosamine 4,6-dehydratase
MTRFWITLPQGVNFVLSSLAMAEGGEIFVPKIPTMTTVDLATALAPHLERRIIGIRPGEKLHEVMISADDSRSTVEYADRYAICPSFDVAKYEAHILAGAAPVADGFAYSSDTNPERLAPEALEPLLVQSLAA